MQLRAHTDSTDSLSLITASATTVDVSTHWHDCGAKLPGGGQHGGVNTAITTATTTEIVPRPEPHVSRVVKAITIRNKDTASNLVTVVHNGVNAAGAAISAQVYKVTLDAGDTLFYEEDRGWYTATASTLGVMSTTVLSTNVINNNGTADTIADVTGLSFPVTSGYSYWFRFRIAYTSAATTTGSRWSINGPATTTLNYTSSYTLTATSSTVNYATAYDTPAASNATSLTTGNTAIVEGFITPSASGTVIARFASEVSASAITALAGSMVEYRRVV